MWEAHIEYEYYEDLCASAVPASLLCVVAYGSAFGFERMWISRCSIPFPTLWHERTHYTLWLFSRSGDRKRREKREKSQKIEVIERENRVINVVAISLAAKQWKKKEDSQWTTRRQENVFFFAGSFHLLSLSHISLSFDQISVKRSKREWDVCCTTGHADSEETKRGRRGYTERCTERMWGKNESRKASPPLRLLATANS